MSLKVNCSICNEEIHNGDYSLHTCAPLLLKLIKELQDDVYQLRTDVSDLESELVWLKSDMNN